MASTVNVAVQGSLGAQCAAFTRPLGGIVSDVAEIASEAQSEPSYLAIDDATDVAYGFRLLAITADLEPGCHIDVTLGADREALRRILLDEVDDAYLAADRGLPGSAARYLEASIAAAEFLGAEYPDDPETRSLNHLVVDIAVWMGWDARSASPRVRAGVLAAARDTEEHPEPNWYVTVDNPRAWYSYEGPPIRVRLEWPWWLPRWALQLVGGFIWDALIETHVAGRRVMHPCDHKARAQDLIARIRAS